MSATTNQLSKDVCDLVRSIYGNGFIALHRPVFEGNERRYLVDCIDSNFVSSVGEKVAEFEAKIAEFTGCKYGVATVNGTAALHVGLQLVGVQRGDEVITQSLTFVATCNALSYAGAHPVFVDVDRDTLGMSARALRQFLERNAEIRGATTYNKSSGRRIAACSPMHTFGLPCRVEDIAAVCADFHIPLVEDAAESLGSFIGARHTGTYGALATHSFNGNKTITTGGGGMIVTNDEALAKRAKHITTTAKIPHPYEFVHDEVGYNYRMPNLNAALGCAQMERLLEMLKIKADISLRYADFFATQQVSFLRARTGTTSNYWLNAIVLETLAARDEFIQATNAAGVMTRPIWRLMSSLDMYKHCQHDGLQNSRWLEARVVNLPSSVPDGALNPF